MSPSEYGYVSDLQLKEVPPLFLREIGLLDPFPSLEMQEK